MITTEGPAPVALILALVFGLSCLGWAASFEMVGRSEGRSGARRLLWRIAAAFAGALTLWTLPLVCVARLSSSVGWSGSGLFAGLAILVLACSLGLRPPGVGRRSAGYVSVMAVGLLSAPLIEIAALRAPASIDLRAGWIGPAAITALVASWLAASHRQPPRVRRGPLAAGAATTAMVALVSSGAALGAQPIQVDPAGTAWLAASAVLATVLVSGFGLLAALFDRQLALTAARATEAIKSHEARLSQVLEHLPFGVMVADAATGALLFANREANRVRGALRTTSSGSDGFVPTGDPLGDPLLRALRDEETISRELQTCRAAENRSVTLEISAFPLYDENRQLVRAIAAFQDVSARVQAEADLRQAQKIDALGQLTGGIAHDTNNLLTAILGNLDLLEPRLTDDHQRTLLRNALSATERGAKLTSQLLGFSRRQALAAGPVDVNRAVEAMSPLLCSTLGGTIQIESDLAPDLWTAYADPTQLELVLLNLSINARDAMPDGGAIRISTANRVLLATECATDPGPGEYVVLSVSDGGTGMTAATLSRAFEPFFTTKGPGHGSGLGLSQVLGIAQQLGGGVRIASEVGLGTTVSLLMPRSLAEIAPAPSNASPSHGAAMLRGKTILLVDDDNDVRTAARALLAQFGCIVIEETNGRAAVARIASPERIDLVIIDFAMPGLTGADAGERMLAIRPGLPILVITGYADADELPGVGGRFPSLQKPFRGAQLAETLSSLVADSSPHAPTDVADQNQAASVLSFPRPRPRPREAESPIMPFSRRDIG